MKFFNGKKGFTIVELIIALNLLGIVSVATGSYISNSFKESNQIATKVEIQTSVTALMNELKTAVKTANIPTLDIVSENENKKEYIINQLKSGDIIPLNIKFNKNSQKVTINDKDTYELIEDIKIEKVEGDNGAKIEIIGMDKKYSLTSTYYTRNTITGCAHMWVEIEDEFIFSTCTENGSQKYECIKCGETKTELLEMSEHILSDWHYNSTQHWRTCEACNNEIVRENHKMTNNKCTVCAYEYKAPEDEEPEYNEPEDNESKEPDNNEPVACTHTLSWAKSETKHYWACEECGYIESQGEHILSYATNSEKHYYACEVCGYIESEGKHTLSYATNSERHYMACEECGYIESQGEHILSYATNSEKHYYACEECGYIESEGKHTLSYATNNEKHYYACEECGYIQSEGKHTLSYATNSEKHYYACEECGYIQSQGEHILSYATSSTKHYYACETCGYINSEAVHSFENNQCTECGYTK